MFIKVRDEKNFTLTLQDHLNGFDSLYNNVLLEKLNNEAKSANKQYQVFYHQILPNCVKEKYKNLDLFFDVDLQEVKNFKKIYQIKFDINNKKFKYFFCSFLGAEHVSRQFFSAILNKTKLWNDLTCSKNFSYSWQTLDGNIESYVPNNCRYFRKFFIADSNFNEKIINMSNYKHCDTVENIHKLKPIIDNSFVNIISETLGTSYVPFITEKFLQSIITKSLFLTYGQPNWHEYLEKYYGFKLYSNIFDYEFDKIKNPIHRVVKLIEMIQKFQHLSPSEWHDLYLIEKDAVEYNYNHYYSKDYLKHLAKFV